MSYELIEIITDKSQFNSVLYLHARQSTGICLCLITKVLGLVRVPRASAVATRKTA